MPRDRFETLKEAQSARKRYAKLVKEAKTPQYRKLAKEGVARCDKEIERLGQMRLQLDE